MWHEIGSTRQNIVLILVAVVFSALVGVGIPLTSSGAPARQERTAWVPPTLTPTATLVPEPQQLEIAAGVAASGGDLIAWQQPAQATPSSTPEARPVALPAAQPGIGAPTTADVPNPARHHGAPASLETVTVTAVGASQRSHSAIAPGPEPAALVAASSAITPTASASPSSAPQPAAAATPSPAPQPIVRAKGAPVLTPSRATPRPATATPAPAPAVERPASATPPTLLSPALDARLRGLVQFDWAATGDLPKGALYEVVVWSPEQDPNQAWGVAPPRSGQSLTINLDELFQSGRFPTGNLYWTVLVVEQNPYERLTQPAASERRYLVYSSEGAGGSCCTLSSDP
jgi:hypothetical protein